MKNILIVLILICGFANGYSQNKELPKYYADPMIIDSSWIMIPIYYKPHIALKQEELWEGHYANILFYNCKTDSIKMLFKGDTYIKPLPYEWVPNYSIHNKQYSNKWIFYFLKVSDYNNNGRFDTNDPYTLYVSGKNGNELRPLTQPNENAMSIDIFDKQGFALIKIQSDTNGNKKFGNREWADFYYIRLDLNSLKLARKIDIK